MFSEVGALQDEPPDVNVCIKPLCFEWSLDRWLAVSKCTMEKVLDLTLRGHENSGFCLGLPPLLSVRQKPTAAL